MSWWMTRRVERQATRMHDMMERVDVDGAALARANEGEVYKEARTRCLTCGTSDKCLRWLESEEILPRRPDFCPNINTFEQFHKVDAGRKLPD